MVKCNFKKQLEKTKFRQNMYLFYFAILVGGSTGGLGLVFSLFFLLFIVDLEVPQLVSCFVTGDHTKPIPQIIFLQVLLGQVFQVPERNEQKITDRNNQDRRASHTV